MAQVLATDPNIADDLSLLDLSKKEICQVSDHEYAEELRLQEVLIMSSASEITRTHQYTPSSSTNTQVSVTLDEHCSKDDVGETSQSFCEICVERKERYEMFTAGSCSHTFCCDCISRHVATKVEQRITRVTCPAVDCKSELGVEICRALVPRMVIDVWEDLLCEQLIKGSERFYCPYKNCSALLVNDVGEESLELVLRESECPICHRLFCVQCYVPWHLGVECEEYQRLRDDEKGSEDLMLRELANDKKWRRCPNCNFYVEKIEGCLRMTCRCNTQFCYGCGARWNDSHVNCA